MTLTTRNDHGLREVELKIRNHLRVVASYSPARSRSEESESRDRISRTHSSGSWWFFCNNQTIRKYKRLPLNEEDTSTMTENLTWPIWVASPSSRLSRSASLFRFSTTAGGGLMWLGLLTMLVVRMILLKSRSSYWCTQFSFWTLRASSKGSRFPDGFPTLPCKEIVIHPCHHQHCQHQNIRVHSRLTFHRDYREVPRQDF